MPVDKCEAIRDLLVDFADGELDGGELDRVSLHVEACRQCADRVDALRRSLLLAGRVWDADHATQSSSTAAAPRGRPIVWHRRVRRGLAVAAMVGLVSLSWTQFRSVESPKALLPVTVAATTVSFEDVETLIWKAGMAARMLESAHVLSEAPGGEQLAAARLRIVLSDYPDTPAAAIAQERLTLIGGTAQ